MTQTSSILAKITFGTVNDIHKGTCEINALQLATFQITTGTCMPQVPVF